MIEKCVVVIADWLVESEVVKETDKELYSYAAYSFILSVSPLLLAIGFGLLLGCVSQSAMIVAPFMLIRKFSGGYHTKGAGSCLFGSCLLLFLCIVLSLHLTYGWAFACMSAGSAVSLIYFSPIDHENRVLSQEERRHCKKITVTLVIICLLFELFFSWIHLNTYSICISIGIMLSAGAQIPCIYKDLVKR